jgi:hypothetical protein
MFVMEARSADADVTGHAQEWMAAKKIMLAWVAAFVSRDRGSLELAWIGTEIMDLSANILL